MTPTQTSTKDRILDTAETLFASLGFEATSLRQITSEAGVNLAAVNYHFQTKEALLDAVIARRAGPINRRRLELLAACQSACPQPTPIEHVLDALFRPVLEAEDSVPRLMVRLHYLESSELFQRIYSAHFRPMLEQFLPAIRRSLTHLEPQETFIRVLFVMGAMAQVLAGWQTVQIISGGQLGQISREAALQNLIQFAAAGLRAPAAAVVTHAAQ